MLPGPDTVYQEGDLLHVATLADELPQVERVLDSAPQPAEA
jgi:trk system potassium uptake protein TrkA